LLSICISLRTATTVEQHHACTTFSGLAKAANTQVVFTLNNFSAIDSARQAVQLTALADTTTIVPDTEVGDKSAAPIVDYRLEQNYPNPFNPSTTIEFSVAVATRVLLKVYNLLGEEVAVLVDKNHAPGRYQIRWNAGAVQSGVYFYRLQTETFTQTRKLILAK
jgi:hypothetical protein